MVCLVAPTKLASLFRIEKNTNSEIGVQCAMLVGTNKTITVRRLRMTPRKRAKKAWAKRKNVTPDHDIEGSKEKSSRFCDVVSTCD
jgi:hypothetical protein